MTNKLNVATRTAIGRFTWLIVLSVVLSISAYSLYFVARHLGVPRVFAIGMSTAFDGTALKMADYSIQYSQEGRSGTAPRLGVLIFTAMSAWLNALHSILGGESPLTIPMWAGLPVAAAALFEVHTGLVRSKALARAGLTYPAPVPKYGGWAWTLFPFKTLNGMRDIISARTTAVTTANLSVKPAIRPAANRPLTISAKPEPNAAPNEAPVNEPADAKVISMDRPNPKDVRAWAKANGYEVGDRARIPGEIWSAYAERSG